MNVETKDKWQQVLHYFEEKFGGGLELEGILFLIGVQELGKGFQQFSKDEKLDVMHIAICTLLEPYGYYTFVGRDEEGWPHYERNKKLPYLVGKEQETLMKDAISNYMQLQ